MKQTIKGAVRLADAGLDIAHDELFPNGYPQKNHKQVDFSQWAAIDFFGPSGS
jgi:hypothetical protein